MPNRLQFETSPYLRQHADNPVDWYPWGEEAFARARAEDKPVLLSVGYSACHWCHVMAHESFEDEPTAALMNARFINVKVDREERPDVDDIYMSAVQALSGRGGWPMTVFLLPDGRPFYGGTYYPPEPRYGMPSFTQVLDAIHDAYANRRDDLLQAAAQLTGALDRAVLGIGGLESDLTAELLDQSVSRYAQRFDARFGGFDGAPKFPQPMNLEFLLRQYKRTGDARTLHMVTHTLEQMACGGIYDQIGGGFARYSTDARWLVPHFEKMLYDNAQLSRVYLHAWQVTGNGDFRQIAEEVYDYILREMTAPEGGFYSATDADSEGEEGKFFVWSLDEVEALLGDDAPVAVELYGITRGGNFEGHNILYLPNAAATAAERLGMDDGTFNAAVARIKDALYAARTQRVAPGLDDKVITAWNGLMLASLAEGARILGRGDYQAAALRAGEFIRDRLITDGDRLLRTYKDGQSKLNGYLEDYAAVIDGFLELYQLTFDDAWFTLARRLADRVLAHFSAGEGGFYDTSDDHEALIVRPRNVQDNAVPSGTGLMHVQLLRLAAYTGDPRYDDAARASLRLLANALREYPNAFGVSASAIDMLVSGVQELALVGDPAGADMQALLDVVRGAYRPNLVVALTPSDVAVTHGVIPLLDARTRRDGRATAYVCEHFACLLPVTAPDAL
ncbi:MAG TPA: thioredoxin domain-containing protein, partial [Aggregatilineales bacterium]|nr:thioredoxin domain-containing protein [Aggregatilineales bacterium]